MMTPIEELEAGRIAELEGIEDDEND
jgi:hypothetical protein